MSVYKRPPRPDELYHWGRGSVSGNHKYIAKIGNRYFYTPEELKAFKQGVSGKVGQAKSAVSDNFSKLRSAVYDRAGGAAKRRAQASAKRANVLKNTVASKSDRAHYDELAVAQSKMIKDSQDSVLNKRVDIARVTLDDQKAKANAKKYGHSDNIHDTSHIEVTYSRNGKPINTRDKMQTQSNVNHMIKEFERDAKKSGTEYTKAKKAAKSAQDQANRDKAAYDKTLMGRAESAGKKINRAKKTAEETVSNAVNSDTAKKVGKAIENTAYRPASGVKALYDSANGFAKGYKAGKEYVEKNGIDATRNKGIEQVNKILGRKRKKKN